MATYDAMAETYARRRYAHEVIIEALIAAGRVSRSSTVLEMGAGTGNHIRALAETAGCLCFGLELSAGMLEWAERDGMELPYVNADATAAPFAGGSFDLVFSVEMIHHLSDPEAYFAEAYRILRSGGRLITVTQSHEMIRARPILSRYFPESAEADLARYPDVADMAAWIRATGFRVLEPRTIEMTFPAGNGEAYAEKAFSCLHLISDAAFTRGLADLQRALAAGLPDEPNENVLMIGEKSARSRGPADCR